MMKKNITDKKIIRALALILSISVFITGCGMTDLYDKFSGKGKADDKKEETGDPADPDTSDALDDEFSERYYIPSDDEIRKDPSAAFRKYTDSLFLSDIKENTINLHYSLAYPENYGIEDYEASIGDLSLEDMDKYARLIDHMDKQLKRYDRDDLSEDLAIAYDIMLDSIGQEKRVREYRFLNDPLSCADGQQQVLPIILSEYTFRRERDVEDYLALISQIDELFDYCIEFEEKKVEKGNFMSDRDLDRTIDQCEQFIADPESNYMIGAFDERIEKVTFLSGDEKEEYKKQNKEKILNEVIPAYEKLIDELDGFHGKGGVQQGICGFDGGKEYYEYLVEANVGTKASIKELENRIDDYIDDRIGRIQDMVGEDPTLYDKYLDFSFELTDPEEIMQDLIKKSKADFPEPPEVNYTIKSVDPSMEEHTNPAFYLTPPIDDKKENVIYINNLSTDPGELYTTLAHEGYPGHLYESVFSGNYDRPLAREMYSWGGYTEGWATYTEFLSYSYGVDDPDLANMLMWDQATTLAIYAYTDIQINYNGWDVDDLEGYLEKYFGDGAAAGAPEMYDYIVEDPAGYLDYFVGYLEFVNLRNKAKNALGDDFSLKEFHQFIMDEGPMPFYMLDERLDEWIKGQ